MNFKGIFGTIYSVDFFNYLIFEIKCKTRLGTGFFPSLRLEVRETPTYFSLQGSGLITEFEQRAIRPTSADVFLSFSLKGGPVPVPEIL
jgi:hypothetical protein